MQHRTLVILSCVCIAASLALACRYTVRDIGFIDLAGQIYTLWIATDAPDGEPARQAEAAARSRLDLSNVAVRILDVRTRPEHPAAGGPALILEGPGGRHLPLGEIADLRSSLEHVARSPVRDDLLAGSVSSFCTILMLESSDATQNGTADRAIAAAIEQFVAMAPGLPRAVEHPVRTVRVPFEARSGEAVLLWSLGLDGAPDQPAIAVLYGRLKLAGPVLVGEGVTPRTLASQLSLVGESCECEANRDWVNEASLPHQWDDQRRRDASASLGFDPGSPMVLAEAVRIIQRGVFTSGELAAPRTAAEETPLDASFFGYSEITIGEPTTNAPEVALQPTEPIRHRTREAEGTPRTAEVSEPLIAEGAATSPVAQNTPSRGGRARPAVLLSLAAGVVLLGGILGAVLVLRRGAGA